MASRVRQESLVPLGQGASLGLRETQVKMEARDPLVNKESL